MKIIVDNRSMITGASAIDVVGQIYASGWRSPRMVSNGSWCVLVTPIRNKQSIRYLIQDAKS